MKRKRRKIRKVRVISLVFILGIITVLLVNFSNIRNFCISKITGYKIDTIEVFMENDIYGNIKDYDYSKTLESIIVTDYYDSKYISEYININYVNDEVFLKNVSLLLDKGYISNDVNKIYESLDNEGIKVLINNEYVKEIISILSTQYFRDNNLERYIKYYNSKKKNVDTTITYVNIGLDNDYYTNVSDVLEQDSITVLVNKYNKLSDSYVPKDLVSVSYGSGTLRKEAALAFNNMCADAKKEKIYIYGGSGYRSYSHQYGLYNNYVARDGKTAADTYSARAGHSEHQTGLAMDILNGRWDYIGANDKEFTWLVNNSYKYGFILRYLEGKEKITGYMYEPWHYRYIGVELATELNNQGITYEEYIAKK